MNIDGEDIELISAEVAKYISDNNSFIKVLKQIKEEALEGEYQLILNNPRNPLSDIVVKQLKELGYKIKFLKNNVIKISWEK